MSKNNLKYGELDRRDRTKGANQVTLPGQAIPLRPAYRQQTSVVSGLDHVSGYKDNIEFWIRTMVRDPEKTARLLDLLERRWFEDGSAGEKQETRLAGCPAITCDEIELEAADGQQRVLGKETRSDRTCDQSDAVPVTHLTTESSRYGKGKSAFRRQEFAAHRPAIECTPLDDDANLLINSDTITPAPIENRAKQDDRYDDSPTGCSEEEAGPGFPKISAWRNTAADEGDLSDGGKKEPQNGAETRVILARPRKMWTEGTMTAASLKSLPLLALSIAISLWFHALLLAEILKDVLRLPITGFTYQEPHSINS